MRFSSSLSFQSFAEQQKLEVLMLSNGLVASGESDHVVQETHHTLA
jgi:hypothetical protein